MRKKFNRRDFLKLAGLLPASLAAPRFLRREAGAKNVVIVVFDALTAYQISLYGYPRETMPNLARLAERAIVYHRHYAGGNYTTTGTASLLTGTNLWTHRAFDLGDLVRPAVSRRNIFNAFQGHYRLAYSHNIYADELLGQFQEDVEERKQRTQLFLGSYGDFIPALFKKDEDLASVSWVRAVKRPSGYAYSLFASLLYEPLQERNYRDARTNFPRGLPTANQDDGFLLEDAIDWTADALAAAPQPFFGYFHFLPPHAPYRTTREFYGRFSKDDYQPPQKPFSLFEQAQDKYDMSRKRLEYDEFLLYVDKEFGRLYQSMEAAGLLENTVLVFTSDHGELFERGVTGHSTQLMYEPVIRVPLLIFEPGRSERLDVQTPTSAMDLLPTLLSLAGQVPPDWSEGEILPPFNPRPDPGRAIYVLRAMNTGQEEPIENDLSVAMVKGAYKLHYYARYPEMRKAGMEEIVELYDVETDPEELNNLAETQKDAADKMLKELKAKLAEVNKPYRK